MCIRVTMISAITQLPNLLSIAYRNDGLFIIYTLVKH